MDTEPERDETPLTDAERVIVEAYMAEGNAYLRSIFSAKSTDESSAIALVRMLRDEQAAHELTRKQCQWLEEAGRQAQEERDAWRREVEIARGEIRSFAALATQRQQETERAMGWLRRWKALTKELRQLEAMNKYVADHYEKEAQRLREQSYRLHGRALALEQRLAKIRDLVDGAEFWFPPLYFKQLQDLLKEPS